MVTTAILADGAPPTHPAARVVERRRDGREAAKGSAAAYLTKVLLPT